MNTRLVDKIYLEKDEVKYKYKNEWINFLDKDTNTIIEEVFQKVEIILNKIDRIYMQDNIIYDNKSKACWLRENYKIFEIKTNDKEVLEYINDNYKTKYNFVLPTKDEVDKLNLNDMYFYGKDIFYEKDIASNLYNKIYKKFEKHKNNPIFNSIYSKLNKDEVYAEVIPIIRMTSKNNFSISNREVFFRWIVLGLVPNELEEDDDYNYLIKNFIKYNFTIKNFFNIEKLYVSSNEVIKSLLEEDTIRVDITPYNQKIIEDEEQGHWSLWKNKEYFKSYIELNILDKKLVARDPKSSITNGTVGIDFGTKSTVVVYQKDSVKIYPMRIGTGNLKKSIHSSQYENPTIMEFNNLDKFIKSYKARDGRPFTRWQDLTISHSAFDSFMNSSSNNFNSFVSELKQWAGDKHKKLRIIDKNQTILDLPPFIELKDKINPIEIYAYYLGLYINNQRNGIFLNYILSFPVTYEIEIIDKIIESFERGIKKSLPQELHNQPKELAKLSVIKGVSEPAAYAVIALQEYGFEPENDEKVFYGVFDFGGGTTDFDFGIYREANSEEIKKNDYIIEHFGAGGDKYLGGENLLELLAFEIFKKNRNNLLEKEIQFILPPECNEFLGSEILLSLSREAKMNTKNLMEKLRPFWEGAKDKISNFEDGILTVNLIDINAVQKVNFELNIDIEEMRLILYKRIEKGVENFFHNLRLAFGNNNIDFGDIEEINIFLAGNSSKSMLLKEIFKNEIAKQTVELKENISTDKEIFNIFEPLGGDGSNLEKPTGKTGVAFGLIETREGGDILVIDHNIKNNKDISFKYYIGESRKKKFKVIIDRDEEYGKWIDFIDASRGSFELYYSSQSIVSSNKVAIDDNGIKKMILEIDVVDEDALVYIRIISPTEFEFVVANESEIEHEKYLGNIQKVSI